MEEIEDDDFKFPSFGKIVLWFFGIVIGLGIVGMALNLINLGFGFAWLPFYNFGAHIKETQQAIDITTDAQRCIDIDAQWNTLKSEVQAINDTQIPNAQQALTIFESKLPKDETTWSPQQQEMDGELQTNITGLQQTLSQDQVQYNALVAEPDKESCLGTIPSFVDIR